MNPFPFTGGHVLACKLVQLKGRADSPTTWRPIARVSDELDAAAMRTIVANFKRHPSYGTAGVLPVHMGLAAAEQGREGDPALAWVSDLRLNGDTLEALITWSHPFYSTGGFGLKPEIIVDAVHAETGKPIGQLLTGLVIESMWDSAAADAALGRAGAKAPLPRGVSASRRPTRAEVLASLSRFQDETAASPQEQSNMSHNKPITAAWPAGVEPPDASRYAPSQAAKPQPSPQPLQMHEVEDFMRQAYPLWSTATDAERKRVTHAAASVFADLWKMSEGAPDLGNVAATMRTYFPRLSDTQRADLLAAMRKLVAEKRGVKSTLTARPLGPTAVVGPNGAIFLAGQAPTQPATSGAKPKLDVRASVGRNQTERLMNHVRGLPGGSKLSLEQVAIQAWRLARECEVIS